MTDPDRILDAIDQTLDRVAVDHCITPGCGLQLRPDGPSPHFCDDICQKTWTERCVPLRPLPPVPDGGRCQFPDPPIRRRQLPPLHETAAEFRAGRYGRARDAVPLLWRLLRLGRRT